MYNEKKNYNNSTKCPEHRKLKNQSKEKLKSK